jgi:hypothetical protein
MITLTTYLAHNDNTDISYNCQMIYFGNHTEIYYSCKATIGYWNHWDGLVLRRFHHSELRSNDERLAVETRQKRAIEYRQRVSGKELVPITYTETKDGFVDQLYKACTREVAILYQYIMTERLTGRVLDQV